jgi:hypothetical protein
MHPRFEFLANYSYMEEVSGPVIAIALILDAVFDRIYPRHYWPALPAVCSELIDLAPLGSGGGCPPDSRLVLTRGRAAGFTFERLLWIQVAIEPDEFRHQPRPASLKAFKNYWWYADAFRKGS